MFLLYTRRLSITRVSETYDKVEKLVRFELDQSDTGGQFEECKSVMHSVFHYTMIVCRFNKSPLTSVHPITLYDKFANAFEVEQ